MTILPLDPLSNRSPEALREFLVQCQGIARARNHPQLVSISIGVDALDPLAVLESIFEPGERHFYAERPSEGLALAGAEAVLCFEARGPGRFAASQSFVDETFEHCIAVGDLTLPFSGPHVLSAFGFASEPGEGDAFAAASLFVPRWQVGHAGGKTVAVANFLVEGQGPVAPVVERVWRAHGKFHSFDYACADFPEGPRPSYRPGVDVGGSGSYVAAVRSAVQRIGAGEFSKVVVARAKDIVCDSPLHPLKLLNGLRQRFPDCYAFSVANGLGQSFIGASPERLASVDQGVLRTEALAGSARRGNSAREDAVLAAELLSSEKDVREQGIVLDWILSRLAPMGIHPQVPARPVVRRLANVQHLHTPIQASLPAGVRLLDVLASLHPTPAVGGMPSEAACRAIAGLESFSRGLYAGAIGWLDSRGDGSFFVGLRSALVEGHRARLYAGAGIVAGSSPEKEFAETELKFKAIEEALLSQ